MWSDTDIDTAFHRLDPAEPEPTPFPLDAWLKLESRLDQAVIDRAVRRRLGQFFAAEVAVVALVGLGWSLWPADMSEPARRAAPTLTFAVGQPGQPGAKPAARVASAATSAAIASATARTAGVALKPVPGVASAVSEALAVAAWPGQVPRHARLGKGLTAPLGRSIMVAASPLGQPVPAKATSAAEVVSMASAPTATTTVALVSPAATASLAATRRVVPATHEPATGNAVSERTKPAGHVSQKMLTEGALDASGTRQPQAPADAAGRAAAATDAPGTIATDATLTAAPAATAALTDAEGTADDLSPLQAVAALLPAAAAPELPARLAAAALAPFAELSRPVRQLRYHVGVVAAPDVSTVKFDATGKPCLNVGLTLDVRLGNRLRLSTGLLRSSKEYVARREDYDWGAYRTSVYSHDFKEVESACTIFDVPLNLRYDLLVRPNYRLVGTAGLSSLFLQRERYYYDWTDATGLHSWTDSAVNRNQHPFRVLNLAAGVEYGLGPRWDLLAEPYIKVPLAGVGMGKVKLLSAGILFGLKYGF